MRLRDLHFVTNCTLFSLAAASPALAQSARAVIVGGALSPDNTAVYRAILDARAGNGPLCVIPTASATPDTSATLAATAFDKHGGAGTARAVMITTSHPESAEDTSIVQQLRACSGYFFTGGVQSRIVQVLRPGGRTTPALAAIRERVAKGAVVSGSSAGAAIMSDPMIAGGSSAGALALGVRRVRDAADTSDTGLPVEPGLGFFTAALADQHFLARGRVGRLVVAVLELAEYDVAFGIDENTALAVSGSTLRAVGASGIVVIDASNARTDGRTASGIRMDLMGSGDTYDLQRRELRIDPSKTPLPRSTAALTPPADPFARFAFLQLLHAFAASPLDSVTFPAAGGEWTLRKGKDFEARHGVGQAPGSVPQGLSTRGLSLEVLRPSSPHQPWP